jgi:hypothetical protein
MPVSLLLLFVMFNFLESSFESFSFWFTSKLQHFMAASPYSTLTFSVCSSCPKSTFTIEKWKAKVQWDLKCCSDQGHEQSPAVQVLSLQKPPASDSCPSSQLPISIKPSPSSHPSTIPCLCQQVWTTTHLHTIPSSLIRIYNSSSLVCANWSLSDASTWEITTQSF